MLQAEYPEKLPVSVMCVDDEQPLLEIISRFISPFIGELFTAENGTQGYELFLEKRPDIIVTDHMMPGVNGLEMSRRIKALSPSTPVVLLTAFYSTEYMSEAIDIGVNQFVPKPLSRSKLMTALTRCFQSIDLERKFNFQQERAQLLSSALEQSHTGVIILDPSGFVEYLNPACERMYGLGAGEAAGCSVGSLGIRADIMRRVADVERSGLPVDIEIEQTGGFGEAVWTNFRISRFDDSRERNKFFVTIDDITTKKSAEKKLQYLATHDPLTGLFNRGYFEEELHRISIGRSFPISLVIADVDRLKMVNDRFGHETGDRLIVKAAEMMREIFRAEDLVARIGGDEFVAILPGASEEVAWESVLRGRRKNGVIAAGSEEVRVSLSFGCSTATDSSMVREMVKRADERMYHEKVSKHQSGASEGVRL